MDYGYVVEYCVYVILYAHDAYVGDVVVVSILHVACLFVWSQQCGAIGDCMKAGLLDDFDEVVEDVVVSGSATAKLISILAVDF